MATVVLALPLGLIVGSVMGLLGAGGALLTVPAMIYLLGEPIESATTASLLVVAATAAVGAAVKVRRRAADPRLAAAFAATGVPGAVLGAWLGHLISGHALLLLLAVLMLVAAAALWRGPPVAAAAPAPRWALALGAGVVVGVLTGLCGVGGGFLIVPALVLLLGLPLRIAVGTSLLVIAASAGAGLLGHLETGGIDWPVTVAFAAAASAGAWLAARVGQRVPTPRLSQGFAVLLVVLAAALVVANAGAVGL